MCLHAFIGGHGCDLHNARSSWLPTSEQVCRALSFVGSCHGRALRTIFGTSLYLNYLFKSPQTPGRYMRARGVVGHAPLKALCMVRGGQTLSPTSLLRISSQHILGCDREHIPCQPSSAPFFSNNLYLHFFFFDLPYIFLISKISRVRAVGTWVC